MSPEVCDGFIGVSLGSSRVLIAALEPFRKLPARGIAEIPAGPVQSSGSVPPLGKQETVELGHQHRCGPVVDRPECGYDAGDPDPGLQEPRGQANTSSGTRSNSVIPVWHAESTARRWLERSRFPSSKDYEAMASAGLPDGFR